MFHHHHKDGQSASNEGQSGEQPPQHKESEGEKVKDYMKEERKLDEEGKEYGGLIQVDLDITFPSLVVITFLNLVSYITTLTTFNLPTSLSGFAGTMATPTPSHPSNPTSASKKHGQHSATPMNFSSPAPRSVPSPAATRKEQGG
ncbi:hypothetical protein KC336_g22319, partial [Hortaea werneckii]